MPCVPAKTNPNSCTFILLFAFLPGGLVAGYFTTDKMMDIFWEYYLKIDFSTLGLAIGSLFLVAVITVGYKILAMALMNHE